MEGRLTILPPPPPLRTMAWAAASALRSRLACAVGRAARALVERLQRIAGDVLHGRAGEGRLSSFVGRLLAEAEARRAAARGPGERTTAVQIRRAG
jgi:hypothetical protein